jgi:hypothetical protein
MTVVNIDVKKIVDAYVKRGFRPLAGAWFDVDKNGERCVCPLAARLIDEGFVDEDGNNQVGHEVRDCKNFIEVASRAFDLSQRDVELFLMGFDGERAPPAVRLERAFRSGRETYGALENEARAGRIGKIVQVQAKKASAKRG